MEQEPKTIIRLMKRADVLKNRIILPKFFIDNYGRDFYLDVKDNGTIVLIPIEKLNKQDRGE